jgi:hypothetical protein
MRPQAAAAAAAAQANKTITCIFLSVWRSNMKLVLLQPSKNVLL